MTKYKALYIKSTFKTCLKKNKKIKNILNYQTNPCSAKHQGKGFKNFSQRLFWKTIPETKSLLTMCVD